MKHSIDTLFTTPGNNTLLQLDNNPLFTDVFGLFRFDALEIQGGFGVDTTDGPTQLVFVGVNGIDITGPIDLTASGLSGFALFTDRGPFTLQTGGGLNLGNGIDLTLFSRGPGEMQILGDLTAKQLFLASNGSALIGAGVSQINGQTAMIRAFDNLTLGGAWNLTGEWMARSEQGDLFFNGSGSANAAQFFGNVIDYNPSAATTFGSLLLDAATSIQFQSNPINYGTTQNIDLQLLGATSSADFSVMTSPGRILSLRLGTGGLQAPGQMLSGFSSVGVMAGGNVDVQSLGTQSLLMEGGNFTGTILEANTVNVQGGAVLQELRGYSTPGSYSFSGPVDMSAAANSSQGIAIGSAPFSAASLNFGLGSVVAGVVNLTGTGSTIGLVGDGNVQVSSLQVSGGNIGVGPGMITSQTFIDTTVNVGTSSMSDVLRIFANTRNFSGGGFGDINLNGSMVPNTIGSGSVSQGSYQIGDYNAGAGFPFD